MKLHVMSDLHLECNMMRMPLTAADVVILAGDIWEGGMKGIEWAAETWSDRPVLYVPGNHEYYSHDFDMQRAKMRRSADRFPNLGWLDDAFMVIDDVAFFGVTLWTDFMYDAPDGDLVAHHASLAEAARYIPDFQSIGIDRRLLMPEDTTLFFEMQYENLRKRLALSDEELKERTGVKHIRKRVVITHHAPSARSVHVKYANSPLTPSFASRLEDTVMLSDVWIHGHTHDSCDYVLKRADGHKTRVVCNPRGYSKGRKNENSRFKPGLVIEV